MKSAKRKKTRSERERERDSGIERTSKLPRYPKFHDWTATSDSSSVFLTFSLEHMSNAHIYTLIRANFCKESTPIRSIRSFELAVGSLFVLNTFYISSDTHLAQ